MDDGLYMPETTERYHKNSARCKDGEAPCFVCGKPCKPETVPYWVRTFQGAFICSDEYAGLPGETGFYPLGAECYRKMPADVKAAVKAATHRRVE